MAHKGTRIDDIKRPDKLTPGSTSRPILVTNRPILASDPMMAPSSSAEPSKLAESMTRTAKTIEPMDTKLVPPSEGPAQPSLDTEVDKSTETSTPESSVPEPSRDAKPESQPGSGGQEALADSAATVPEAPAVEPKHDSEARVAADEVAVLEAQAARQQELEQLIASGKYAVPINAMHHKRSHAYLLLLASVVVIALLLDVALDMGLVKLAVDLPHTSFF